MVFLKIPQDSLESTSARVSFFNKVTGLTKTGFIESVFL